MIDRRSLLALAGATAASPALAQAPQGAKPAASMLEIRPIWPGKAPGGEKVTVKEQVILRTPGGDPNDTAFLNITDPVLMMRRPEKPNGAAILMIPGGGYKRVAVSKAGGAIDRWIADQGVTAFVMTYRLPADGWAAGPDVALQDAQRAIRIIRSRAGELGLDPARVGVMGFSAGGHLAGRLATQFKRDTYAPIDAVDQLSTRPSVAGLFYPVVTMQAPFAHGGSLKELLAGDASEARRKAASLELDVPADTPPTFIATAADDKVVPADNSLLLYSALRAAGVPSELHMFEKGGHGFGLTGPGGMDMGWPQLLPPFLRRHGLYA
ncbi:alpha/beta hydrolase [Caulobacter flavus]|uniref:Alpha/beta hydrolase n=1 Tax=Caulobacter flavus TaxID=1679497 RepID=A0A2N5CXK6_9CAUL|nr:alpha/beta hydrolase [Caulobacter flavus]AYV47300.1 alpha/beta hydrolase [Caulobacter flavus]PLR18539.1 alpha/beta hydrolase [Caulobacter flavus]